jgi:hypothetical protein
MRLENFFSSVKPPLMLEVIFMVIWKKQVVLVVGAASTGGILW